MGMAIRSRAGDGAAVICAVTIFFLLAVIAWQAIIIAEMRPAVEAWQHHQIKEWEKQA